MQYRHTKQRGFILAVAESEKVAGKKQYLIPYFIVAHPRTSDEDMHLTIWLKKNGFRADQVQTFYPSPMATTMYHTHKNPLRKITRDSEKVDIVRGDKRRRLHKAFLRHHDANNWPLSREALKTMGCSDLIGNGKHHLIATFQPLNSTGYTSGRKKNSTSGSKASAALNVQAKLSRILTQHTGLPPPDNGAQCLGAGSLEIHQNKTKAKQHGSEIHVPNLPKAGHRSSPGSRLVLPACGGAKQSSE